MSNNDLQYSIEDLQYSIQDVQNKFNNLNETLIETLNDTSKTLLKNVDNNIKYIINSKIFINNKNININPVNTFLNTNYNNIKKILNLGKKKPSHTSAPAQGTEGTNQINKNALLIGCNYLGTRYQLNGCINDVKDVEIKLKSQYKFNNILIMTDNTPKKPTKENILDEIKTLLTNANSGDKVFLLFSGHGTTIKDTNSDEKDGVDELFVPLDFNCISDDEIKSVINNNLKKDVTLFCLFDCCHSGTILDLRYQYFDSENYDNSSENTNETETVGNVVMISGCRDSQFSADAYINFKSQGAATWSFLDALSNNNPNLTWKDLLTTMRSSLLKGNYQQTPQLSSGNKLDINTKFYLL